MGKTEAISSDPRVKKLMTYRWIVWGILVLAYMVVFFHRLSIGVVREDLINAFGISETTFANIGTTYFYVYLIMQIPSGMLTDSLGPRKTVSAGILVSGIGSIIFGFASNVFWVFTGRFLVGLGVSVVFVSVLKIQSQWFKESEFGTMSGLTCFVGTIGGILAQTPLAIMIAALTWRISFAGIGVIALVVGVLCCYFIRNSPGEMDLPLISELENTREQNKEEPKVDIVKGLITVVKNLRTWPVFFSYAGVYGAYVAMMGIWGPSYINQVYNISKTTAPNYMISGVIGSAIGAVVIGKISDRIRKRKLPMLIFGAVYVLCWALIVFVNGGKPPIGILMILLFTLGFASSSYVLGWACSKEINPPEIVGISTSVANMGGFFGSIILPPIMGKVFDIYGNTLSGAELYQRAFIYCFASALIGMLSIFLIKETNCKNIFKHKS